ncbi:MAG TPA: hypothetical protein VN802_20770 [Stellaceae bacterium]|nr:hypothetical protein [Stellaceae bacterium]
MKRIVISTAAATALLLAAPMQAALASACQDGANIVRTLVVMKRQDAATTPETFLAILRTGQDQGYRPSPETKTEDDAAMAIIRFALDHVGDGPNNAAASYYRSCMASN